MKIAQRIFSSRFISVKFLNKVSAVLCFVLLASCICGCSKPRHVSTVPKTKSQLLLEIYEAAEKKQYGVALQKIERFRLLDPANSIMPEFEHMIRFNQLAARVHEYVNRNDFQGALSVVQGYERKHGISKRTAAAKEQLLYFARLDSCLERVRAAKDSVALEKALTALRKMEKERKFTPKTMNFIRKEQSKLRILKEYERFSTGSLLCSEAFFLMEKRKDLRTAEVLCSLAEMVNPRETDLLFLREKLSRVQ